MMPRAGSCLVVLALCGGCRPAPTVKPPQPPAAAAPPAARERPSWRISFAVEGDGHVELLATRAELRTRHPVPDGTTRTGPHLATTSFSGVGVVAQLGPWLAAQGDELAVEVVASEACDAPWILDLDAAALQRTTHWRGPTTSSASVRIGCGPVQHAVFMAETGHERTVFYGASEFDVRSVAGEIAVIRSRIEQVFGVAIDAAWRTEVVLGPGASMPLPRPPYVAAVERGIAMALDGDGGWSAETRLALAATVAGVWLRRALGPTDDAAERAVLAGLARGIAREEVFALGLISPDEYAADLDRDEAALAEARSAGRRGDGRWRTGLAAVHALDVASATWMVRERGGRDIVGQLVAGGRTEPPSARWAALVDSLLDTPRAREPLPTPIARRRLGPCIVARTRPVAIADLGFDLAAEPDPRGLSVIAAVVAGGPAERAGLVVGDAIVAYAPGPQASVVVLRAEGPVRLELSAQLRRTRRRGWQRTPTIADDHCYPR